MFEAVRRKQEVFFFLTSPSIAIMSKDALVLSQNQWDQILKWIPNNEQEQQDEIILKYLQESSENMKSKWPENNKTESFRKVQRSLNPEMMRYEAIKNADSAKRREMIAEAERFVSNRKIKECPIELRSAAILSENLAGRNIQLELQAVQKEEEKAKTALKNKHDMIQSVAWLQDGFQHRTNAYRIALQHKKELLDSIKQRKKERDEEKATRIAQEKRNIDQHFKNIHDKKVRDRKMKEKQNEYMRKHEVETVLMAKQKRDRMKRENKVIDVLAKVHNEGKNNVKELIKQQENQAKVDRAKFGAILGDMAKIRDEIEKEKLREEQKMIIKVHVEKEKILDKIEEKAKDKKEFLKNDRKQDYKQSLQAAEVKKALRKEEDKEYFKNRIMNDVVSFEYSKMKKEAKKKRIMENLSFLKQQDKELRVETKREREDGFREFNKKIDEDTTDQKFFDYAKDLLDDAQSKNRPLKPIHQVTKAYKNLYFIDIVKRLRPHEISNVPIEMEIHKIECNRGKSKRRIKYEKGEELLKNAYRSTKFLNVD
jgi:hypothetical protein